MKRNGLHRRLHAQSTNFRDRRSAGSGHDLLQGRTAETPLASAHAAARDRLDPIDLARTQRCTNGTSNFSDGHRLASAGDGFVGQCGNLLDRPCEGLGQASLESSQTFDLPPQADQLGLWLRPAQICEQRVSGERTACLCGVRSADRRAVAGQVEISPSPSVGIRLRQPEPEGRIEPEARPGQLGQLRLPA